jgi:hypothetical protein
VNQVQEKNGGALGVFVGITSSLAVVLLVGLLGFLSYRVYLDGGAQSRLAILEIERSNSPPEIRTPNQSTTNDLLIQYLNGEIKSTIKSLNEKDKADRFYRFYLLFAIMAALFTIINIGAGWAVKKRYEKWVALQAEQLPRLIEAQVANKIQNISKQLEETILTRLVSIIPSEPGFVNATKTQVFDSIMSGAGRVNIQAVVSEALRLEVQKMQSRERVYSAMAELRDVADKMQAAKTGVNATDKRRALALLQEVKTLSAGITTPVVDSQIEEILGKLARTFAQIGDEGALDSIHKDFSEELAKSIRAAEALVQLYGRELLGSPTPSQSVQERFLTYSRNLRQNDFSEAALPFEMVSLHASKPGASREMEFYFDEVSLLDPGEKHTWFQLLETMRDPAKMARTPSAKHILIAKRVEDFMATYKSKIDSIVPEELRTESYGGGSDNFGSDDAEEAVRKLMQGLLKGD